MYMYLHNVKKDGLTETSPKSDNEALGCFSISLCLCPKVPRILCIHPHTAFNAINAIFFSPVHTPSY